MADNGEGQEKRKGGKGKLLAILALIGAGVACPRAPAGRTASATRSSALRMRVFPFAKTV